MQDVRYVELINRIKLRIDERGIKQRVVAERAGFNENEFSAMLNGRKLLRAEYIPTIANALEVSVNELFDTGKQKSEKMRERI